MEDRESKVPVGLPGEHKKTIFILEFEASVEQTCD